MTKQTIYLNKKEFEDIANALSKFPDLESFQLEQENSSGIGSLVNLIVSTKVNDILGRFIIPITTELDW